MHISASSVILTVSKFKKYLHDLREQRKLPHGVKGIPRKYVCHAVWAHARM